MESLILIGGGGHCKSCIEVIESTNKYKIVGILDVPSKLGSKILDYEVIGTDSDISNFIQEGINNFFITLGQIKSATIRKKIFNKVFELGGMMPTIISKYAIVSSRSKIGKGTIIMHGSVVNADVSIGDNCIINNQANIEHDVSIGNHVHVSTGAVVNGQVSIGDEVLIGSNAVVKNVINICEGVVVGAGSVINKDIIEPGVYVGNPFRRI